MEGKKHVFWQALILTAVVFVLGLVFGVYLEQNRSEGFNTAFYESEVSLYDSLALSQLVESETVSCAQLQKSILDFADKIYEESVDLERFDEKNKLTDSLKTVHRKYDLLRTLLWMNAIEMKEKCNSTNTVVYLYEYSASDLQQKSAQTVWSKWLSELKQERGGKVLLIPIAADSGLSSLDSLVERFGVTQLPAVVVNEDKVFYDIEQAESIKAELK